jgi:hypothetical protein
MVPQTSYYRNPNLINAFYPKTILHEVLRPFHFEIEACAHGSVPADIPVLLLRDAQTAHPAEITRPQKTDQF